MLLLLVATLLVACCLLRCLLRAVLALLALLALRTSLNDEMVTAGTAFDLSHEPVTPPPEVYG